ncbi:hypothetical protein FJZ31_08240 [Candidatus Poribacteria bacterium]|nr:hypothetical protein [Candidatus Poribacteria bacterium]
MGNSSANSNINVSESELAIDQDVAKEICSRLEFDGQRFRCGQYVAILMGKIIAIGDDFDEVQRALVAQEPNPHKGLICQVEEPIPDIIR